MGLYSSCLVSLMTKLGYLSFDCYFICYTCFEGTCAVRVNWVGCPKINDAKLDHKFNRWYQSVYGIIFIVLGIIWKFFQLVHCFVMITWQNVRKVIIVEAMSNNCLKIPPLLEIQHDVSFRRISVQWMGSGYACMSLTKVKHKTWHNMHFPYNPIKFAPFPFETALNLLTLHTPQWNNPKT